MPRVLSRGYFHRQPSERRMLMWLPKPSSTRASAMLLPHNTPTQSGIQRQIMSTRLYPPFAILVEPRLICASHQSLPPPVLRLRVGELITVTRLEHIIRAFVFFSPPWPLICGVSKRASLAYSESAKGTLKAGP